VKRPKELVVVTLVTCTGQLGRNDDEDDDDDDDDVVVTQ
jgi:hypothetical protein